MKIRPYKKSDWESVKEIYNLSKPDEMIGSVNLKAMILLQNDPKMIQLFNESKIIVAEIKNKVVAFAGNKGNYISWLFVHRDYRRKKIAHTLLDKILKELKGSIKLNVAQKNIFAIRLYESFEFNVIRKFNGNFNGYKSKAITLELIKE